jgi:hypothetical protein
MQKKVEKMIEITEREHFFFIHSPILFHAKIKNVKTQNFVNISPYRHGRRRRLSYPTQQQHKTKEDQIVSLGVMNGAWLELSK